MESKSKLCINGNVCAFPWVQRAYVLVLWEARDTDSDRSSLVMKIITALRAQYDNNSNNNNHNCNNNNNGTGCPTLCHVLDLPLVVGHLKQTCTTTVYIYSIFLLLFAPSSWERWWRASILLKLNFMSSWNSWKSSIFILVWFYILNINL